ARELLEVDAGATPASLARLTGGMTYFMERKNQFVWMDETLRGRLFRVYTELLLGYHDLLAEDEGPGAIGAGAAGSLLSGGGRGVMTRHHENLLGLLSDAVAMTGGGDATGETVCSEYSAEFQLGMLHAGIAALREPVLDIGCGEEARLL